MAAFLGDDDSVPCVAVVNDLGQHSIWPHDRDLPAGWRPAGRQGTRRECLAFIEEVWPDPTAIRPVPPGR